MIADLECISCGKVEERFYQSTQPKCSACGSETKKLISADWSFTFTNGKGTSGGLTVRAPAKYKQIKRG